MKISNLVSAYKNLSRVQQLILGLIVLSLLWIIISSVYGTIHAHLIRTMTVESETRDIVYSDYGFIQPQQALLKADVGGDVTINCEQGDRVAKNHEVFSVNYQTEDGKSTRDKHFYAAVSGIVSYQIDGYEDLTNIDDIEQLDLRSIYEKSVSSKKSDEVASTVASDTVFAKVIDNLQPVSLYMAYNPDSNDVFDKEGDTFNIRFPELNVSTVATVEEIVDKGDGSKFCRLSLGPVTDDFLLNRVVQVECYRTEEATLSVPNDCIVYENNEPGVYTLDHRIVTWTSVTIINQDDQNTECEILPEGTEIILTPKRVEKGNFI